MPKRRPEKLTGIRIELQERDRELVETAIYVNGFAKTVQGIGTAIGGLGLAGGLVIAAAMFGQPAKEALDGVADWFKEKKDLGKTEWVDENCSQEKYNAYIQLRVDKWIKEAKKAGRYEPAVGDAENYSWWRYLDKSAGVTRAPLRFAEWEKPLGPLLLFDAWCNERKAKETIRRRVLVGSIFPGLNIIGILQYGFKDWFSGRK